MASKIKKGDRVIAIAGKNKGQTGEVMRCLSNDRILVSGLNMVKKHQKANPNKGTKGSILEKEQPIHISNIALLDQKTNKPSRVGFKILADGKKVRYLKSNNEVIDA